eukprot:m.118458 g.118458  ORF g.118458 m.118458 type:complete len:52 (+) comp14277_c1_seq20:2864-3019(+)
MAYLRNSEEFMSNNMRQQMQNGFLGFMDPVDWGWVDVSLIHYQYHANVSSQ